MIDLTDKIGRTGCNIRYDWGQGYGYDRAPHAMLQRAISGPLTGVGYLNVGGKRREFSVLCVRYPQPMYVIHPKDAGWVIKRVEPLMKVKPAWARPTRKIPLDRKQGGALTRFTDVPDWVDWVDTRWVCQQCLPKQTSSGWNPKQCDPDCTISPASKVRQYDHNYDSRAMSPWTEDLYIPENCERTRPGPRDPSSSVICIPAIVPSTSGCRSHRVVQKAEGYWAALWASVGDAIEEYNRRNPVRDDAEVEAAAPYEGLQERRKSRKTGLDQEGTRKSAWNTPLVLSLVAVGVAGAVIYASRGS